MANIIMEIISVVPATGWHFGDPILDTEKNIADLEPVVCFAVALTVDPQYIGHGPAKKMIPLDADAYQDLDFLQGKDVSDFNRQIIHFSHVVGADPDDE